MSLTSDSDKEVEESMVSMIINSTLPGVELELDVDSAVQSSSTRETKNKAFEMLMHDFCAIVLSII